MRQAVEDAMKSLHIAESKLSPLRLNQYEAVLNQVLEVFTNFGSSGRNRPWLWENFKGDCETYFPPDNQNLTLIRQLVSDSERVWFIAEDFRREKADGNYWLFEGEASAIQAVLGEIHHFEYYLIAKDFSWLLCENHHNALIGVGEVMTERIRKLKREVR